MLTRPHAFVAMPFGRKPAADGQEVDFNRVFTDLIAPAVEAAGLSVFRADKEQRAGDIRTDMFQELLVADLVIADLTIDNPNVWYELGVRHALRARGVVLICGGRVTPAFDIYTDRKLRYGLAAGGPDPATLEQDRGALTEMVKATMESWHGRKVSPVYFLLPNLREPEWKALRIGDVREFWEKHEAWERRIDLARKAGEIGDLLVLADEAPVAWFRAEAWIRAGKALSRAGRFVFALEQLERGLEIEPFHRAGLQEKGICLQRSARAGLTGHSLDRARDHYEAALAIHPADPELLALRGRVDKDAWITAWREAGATPEKMRDEAAQEVPLLRMAIKRYEQAYRIDPRHYFSGINALTLMHLHDHLTPGAEFAREAVVLAGAVRFAAENEREPGQLFWARATLGEIEVLSGTPDTVKRAYAEAVAANDRDWFALDSSRSQLVMLQELGFRPDAVAAGIAVLDRALSKLQRPESAWEPRQVFLFSGHVIDAPNRPEARFPAQKEGAARERIEAVLEEHGAGPEDLAFSQAAAGGDLLFVEACQARGVRCRLLLPFTEAEFIQKSILPSAGGAAWKRRFYAAKDRPHASIRIMDESLGPAPRGVNPFERCNHWLLYSALARGIQKVRFLCLWNGGGGDGPGGTAHMYNEVHRRTGRVDWIDTRTL